MRIKTPILLRLLGYLITFCALFLVSFIFLVISFISWVLHSLKSWLVLRLGRNKLYYLPTQAVMLIASPFDALRKALLFLLYAIGPKVSITSVKGTM